MADRRLPDSSPRPHVVIAGGGFAALETALALRALAGERVRLTLVAPNRAFAYRPAATIEAFTGARARSYDLGAIAADLGATHHRFSLEAVAPQQRWVRLGSGARLHYDTLVLAVGARARAGIPGALVFRDQRDVAAFRRVLGELEEGAIARLTFVVPTGCAWALPLYELALLAATRLRQLGVEAELTIVTPERTPLAVFGERGSKLVSEMLEDLAIRFIGATAATGFDRDGRLSVAFDVPLRADRVVAVPQLVGRRITGIPATWWGFVPTDVSGAVEGLSEVFAAGDATTFPVKQAALAAQQAALVASTIAAGLGIRTTGARPRAVLVARLLAGERTLSVRTELDEAGRPLAATVEHVETSNTAPAAKVFARHLTPYLERLREGAGLPDAA